MAEGFLDGKIVARTKNMPSKRNEQLVLTVDSGLPLRANGSDMVTVIASITDKDGYVRSQSPCQSLGDCTCTDPYNNESRYYQNKSTSFASRYTVPSPGSD